MAKMMHLILPKTFSSAAPLAATLLLCAISGAYAQSEPPPQGVSRGENFSAKPPAQLFASDCTGAGCHKSPQGLGRTQGFGSLTGFLREHYTNSRESAAALANYLSKMSSGPEPREARTPRSGKPAAARAAARSEDEPTPVTRHHPASEPAEKPDAKPSARDRRNHQPATAAVTPPPPEPEAAPAAPPPPAPPAPPKPKQYDIFD